MNREATLCFDIYCSITDLLTVITNKPVRPVSDLGQPPIFVRLILELTSTRRRLGLGAAFNWPTASAPLEPKARWLIVARGSSPDQMAPDSVARREKHLRVRTGQQEAAFCVFQGLICPVTDLCVSSRRTLTLKSLLL